MKKFLVFLEQRESIVKQSSLSVWNRVQELAALDGNSVVAGILAGPVDTGQLDGAMAGDGVIYHAGEDGLGVYNQERYTRVVADTFTREACTDLFFADTVMARDMAPRLSVRIQASLLSGRTTLDSDDGVSRRVYSGSFQASFVPTRQPRIYILSSSAPVPAFPDGGRINFIDIEPQQWTAEDLFPIVRRIIMGEGPPEAAVNQVARNRN